MPRLTIKATLDGEMLFGISAFVVPSGLAWMRSEIRKECATYAREGFLARVIWEVC